MARRPESQYGRSSKDPLESLVYAAIPSLAPRRSLNARTGGANSLGRSSVSASSSRPGSRASTIDAGLLSPTEEREELERRAKVRTVLEFCNEVLTTQPASAPPDGHLPETVRRILAETSTGSSRHDSRSSEQALRFGGIWSKLERGKTLSVPLRHLQFLLALSPLNPENQPQASSSKFKLPAVPSRKVLEAIPSISNVPPKPVPSSDRKGKSKAEVLREWRVSQAQPPFPEDLLLRDVLYLLQGIDGRYIKFAIRPPAEQNPYKSDTAQRLDGAGFALGKGGVVPLEGEEGEVVGIDVIADEQKDGYISRPTRTLLMQIAEMGMLYRKVISFLDTRKAGTSKSGMTEQSLCHFLHHELSDYHRLLAVLESQLVSNDDGPNDGSGLTLLRMGLWTEDMKVKMRYLASVVDDAKLSHGGALVSRIHQETNHGDPFVRKLMNQILEEVSKPFFSTLQKWIFAGELSDPFKEFFVQLNQDIPDGRVTPAGDVGFEEGVGMGIGNDEAHKVWEKKYKFVKAMVPGFVSEEFAKKIFSTGRSLNFIRYSCRDSDWIETQAKLANAGRALKYTDLAGLERSIDDAYLIASQRLLEVFFDKYALLDHLNALKSYLMLGAGDFTELLMESLAPRLSKPAISLYRHHLTSDLESAIRGSNAQYDSPDILRRLDARILEYSHGEIGWDCFALEYKVEAPLNAVLDAKAMVDYDRVFHHLWKLKRVEVALTEGWMRVVSGSRLFEQIHNVRNDWHHCRIVQAEMVHFLRQIQAYCQLEVIECSWQSLIDFTDKRKGDLDTLIQAHRIYLDRIVKKILLLGSKREKEEVLLGLLKDALDSILNFRNATDDLYAWSLGEATRLDRLRDEERGLYTPAVPDDDPNRSLEKLRAVRDRIRSYSITFQDKVVSICHLAAGHADLDVRFLAIRIAFNGHYELRKSKKSAKAK